MIQQALHTEYLEQWQAHVATHAFQVYSKCKKKKDNNIPYATHEECALSDT